MSTGSLTRPLDSAPASMAVTTRRARAADIAQCGRICYEAFADIAARHGFPSDFGSVEIATALLSDLVEHPGFFSLVAEVDGEIVGSSFLDERAMITGVGHVTVDPAVQDRRIGRTLMETMLHRCAQRNVPGVRLLQAAYNYGSMSLYARLGFDLREPIAAIQGDPLGLRITGYVVRPAGRGDLPNCAALCLRVHGHARDGELRDALRWGDARVVERNGRITGYTSGIGFYGHAVAETDDDLHALIGAAEEFPGPGFLVPMHNTELLRWCLAHGLRVSVVLNPMTTGLYSEPRGSHLASMWH